ncbi:hypothetical protein UPYG_G00010380 [Umbra pygmaea]|uniref:Perforin-1-like n=1 Tax=Umbra pygmaea TaxID=75934 RepID=A0ABD0XZI4_UMBPY
MMPSLCEAPLVCICLLLLSWSPLGICQVSHCRQGTPQECMDASFVPGHSIMGRGIDVVTLQLKEACVIDSQSYLTSTTNSCTLCENPLMGNRFEKLPISVQDWSVTHSCRLGLSSSTFSSVSSLVGRVSVVQNDWKTAVGLAGFTGLQLEGSQSPVSVFASARAKNDKSLFALQEFSCSHYSYRLFSHLPLQRDFLQEVLSLPQRLNSSSLPMYRRFIATYGTHYIPQATLGGSLKWVTSVRTCLASLNKVSVNEVRACVHDGLSVGLGLLDPSALSDRCTAILRNQDREAGYSQGFLNHMTQVTGGDGWQGQVSMFKNDSIGFHNWLSSIQVNPDVVSFSLLPLHVLVTDVNISANLQSAVRQYIKGNGISQTPQRPSCKGPNLTGQCCPIHTRRGRLQVNVINAWGLKGDPTGGTEGYVKLWYGSDYKQTHWIKSNNNPHWNSHFDYGNVHTGQRLKLEVWDKDVKYDDHLGGCSLNLVNGNHYHTCGLNRGGFAFSYSLVCDNHLTGTQCNQYKPSLS